MSRISRGILAFLLLAGVTQSTPGAYPEKPIRLIVTFPAGGMTDILGRTVAQKLTERLGQPVIIDNRGGMGGSIGTQVAAKAAPDGYTIGGFNDSIMTMLPNLHTKMPWDILKDFEPVSLVATVEWGLVASNNAPYKNAADLIAAAKANPGKIDYATGGNGSPQHIAMALFASTAGVSLTHVPYKGATQAALDVAAGQVPVSFQGLATVASLIRGGKLRLLGVTTHSRLAQFAGVPTVSESGLPGFEFNSWFTIMAPAGTPKEIIARLNAEILKALADPGVREKLNAQGLSVRGSSPEELGAATREQLAKYARLMKQAGVTIE